MSKCYSKAPDECTDRVAHLLKCFHEPLVAAGVRIDLLSVCDDEGESCLTHQGYPAHAVVRIVGPKDRVKGAGDAEIVIDEPAYRMLPDATKDALLDHELHHLELRLDKKGRVKGDENGRPMLKLRKHDHQFGWFDEIAKRHGAASIECRQATTLYLEGKQTLFAFALESDLQQRLEAATTPSEPSAKVRALAEEIKNAHPVVQAAARDLVSHLRQHNATMTIKSGEQEMTL